MPAGSPAPITALSKAHASSLDSTTEDNVPDRCHGNLTTSGHALDSNAVDRKAFPVLRANQRQSGALACTDMVPPGTPVWRSLR
jgi:hypothetical protein